MKILKSYADVLALTVEQRTELRKKLKEVNRPFNIVSIKEGKISVEGKSEPFGHVLQIECLEEILIGENMWRIVILPKMFIGQNYTKDMEEKGKIHSIVSKEQALALFQGLITFYSLSNKNNEIVILVNPENNIVDKFVIK